MGSFLGSLIGGLTGPIGSLLGVVIDKVVDAVWVRVEKKIDDNRKFSTDVKGITADAKQLKDELSQAHSPEEKQAILHKIGLFEDRLGNL